MAYVNKKESREFSDQNILNIHTIIVRKNVCDEVLWSSQPNGVMSSAVSLHNHAFTGQA